MLKVLSCSVLAKVWLGVPPRAPEKKRGFFQNSRVVMWQDSAVLSNSDARRRETMPAHEQPLLHRRLVVKVEAILVAADDVGVGLGCGTHGARRRS